MRLPLRYSPNRLVFSRILTALLLTAAVPLAAVPAWALPAQELNTLQQVAKRQAVELQRRYPTAELSWSEQMLGPNVITGLQLDVPGDTVERKALQFIKQNEGLWGIHGDNLHLWHTTRSRDRSSVRLNLSVPTSAGELLVLDRVVVVTFDGAGRLITVTSDLVPLGAVQVGSVGEEQARQLAAHAVFGGRENQSASTGSARLAVVASLQATQVVWAVDVVASRVTERFAVLVDGQTGAIVSKRSVAIH